MALQVRDRFHPQLQSRLQQAIDAGRFHKRAEVELLAPSQIQTLALLSLLLLIGGGLFFIVFNILAYLLQTHVLSGSIGGWGFVAWIGINILGGILILAVHEAIHGLTFLLWGGTPHFGARLPFALYCGAKNQLFQRNQYLVVGLAPLVVISFAFMLLALLTPSLASYALIGVISNCSGAAGDVWVTANILRLPKSILIEDTETGYRAWEISN